MKIGLDVGSTTIKAVVLNDANDLLYARYERHYSQINDKAIGLLQDIIKQFPNVREAPLAISGSAGMGLAKRCNVPFVQEVHATHLCAGRLSPNADVIIELGGEDAKILFLRGTVDARMNGSCAGGTGAFIDQMSTLLKISPAELNEKAGQHEKIYSIASRCGVFAKTDVQPLLNQGARIEDVAASILYSVVNQTVAGLAQGRRIDGNVLYLGGPLTFMSELRAAFNTVLGLKGILPSHSLYYVAAGAAIYADSSFSISEICENLTFVPAQADFAYAKPLFLDEDEYRAFQARHAKASVPQKSLSEFRGRAHLGIDAGSTTIKTVLISEEGDLLHSTYQPNCGNPVPLMKEIITTLYADHPSLTLCSVTATGYGEQLIKEAFGADFGLVETMAHFYAAKYFRPNVDFIIDIGGQDMKCFKIEDGAISDIYLNEACSSGCGSFLQTFAEALGQDVASFSKLGLFGNAPVDLGSRCTVFMNSSVKQAQKDGVSIENISAGLAISIIKNALYKVIRISSPEDLGRNIVVQGGTFLNDAVLRAFERELSIEAVRPSIAGLMGAFGAALYGRSQSKHQEKSAVLDADALSALTHRVDIMKCGMCTNQCSLTVNTFSKGRRYISGNRCDRPITHRSAENPLDIYDYKLQLLSSYAPVPGKRGKIGMPFGLNFFETLPFWHTLMTKLGFEVHMSPPSTRKLYFSGQATIPSDTVCYPAKLMHGHIAALAEQGFDTIFYPCMTYNINEDLGDNHFNCPVVAYYPEVIAASCKEELRDKTFLYDYVGIHRPKDFIKRFYKTMREYVQDISFQEIRQAARAAYTAYAGYLSDIRSKGAEIIKSARSQNKEIIVLAGRPYHADNEINHGINKLIASHGAAVISEDCVSHLTAKKPANVLNQWTYHARLYAAAHYIANHEDMNLVQLVSFGCGLDAVTTDEVREILHRHNKLYTQIKIDEIVNLGAVNIRIRSLFAALNEKRQTRRPTGKEAV